MITMFWGHTMSLRVQQQLRMRSAFVCLLCLEAREITGIILLMSHQEYGTHHFFSPK